MDYKKVLENRSERGVPGGKPAGTQVGKDGAWAGGILCVSGQERVDEGQKFEYAKEACVGVVKSLQEHDFFSLVTFDSEIELVFPMGQVESKEETIEIIKSLEVRG